MEDEQMTVLRLLEEGRITAAEAERLLAALERRAPRRPDALAAGLEAIAHGFGRGAEAIAEGAGRGAEALAEGAGRLLEMRGFPWFGPRFRFEETVEGEIGGGATAELAIATCNGRIVASAADEDGPVRVVLHKTVRATSDGEARARAAAIGQATVEPGRVVVAGGNRWGWWGSCRVDVELQLPRRPRWSGTLETSNGRVDLDGLSVGALEVSTSNGRVQLLDCAAEDLAVRTSNGRIEGRRVGGRVRLRTHNGGIEVSLSPVEGANRLVAETSNGAIRVEGPGDGLGWEIDAETSAGRVYTNLPGIDTRAGAGGGWAHARARGTTPAADEQPRRVHCEARTHNGSVTIDAC